MRHRRGAISAAIMFFVFAVMFSLVFWPDVSLAAKLAFFAAGIGCGASITRFVRRGQTG
jgi:hypothetical protein